MIIESIKILFNKLMYNLHPWNVVYTSDFLTNTNKTISKTELQIAINEYQEKINKRLSFGHYGRDHDITKAVDIHNICHFVTKLKIYKSGKYKVWIGILDTPTGRLLHTFLKAGLKHKMQSNLVSECAWNKYNKINYFKILSFDIVLKI